MFTSTRTHSLRMGKWHGKIHGILEYALGTLRSASGCRKHGDDGCHLLQMESPAYQISDAQAANGIEGTAKACLVRPWMYILAGERSCLASEVRKPPGSSHGSLP